MTPLESYERKMDRLRKLVKGVVTGPLNGLVISGPPGIGKTYTVERELERYEETHDIIVDIVRGHITPLQMFERLYASSTSQHITVFDDTDNVFQNVQALNILKAAVETSEVRKVSWSSRASSVPEFFYSGKIFVLTNADMKSSHYKAMIDRFHVYNPLITVEEKLYKIKEISHTMEGLDPDVGDEVVEYLFKNKSSVFLKENLTLRTFVKVAELAVALPNDWQDMAECTILNHIQPEDD